MQGSFPYGVDRVMLQPRDDLTTDTTGSPSDGVSLKVAGHSADVHVVKLRAMRGQTDTDGIDQSSHSDDIVTIATHLTPK